MSVALVQKLNNNIISCLKNNKNAIQHCENNQRKLFDSKTNDDVMELLTFVDSFSSDISDDIAREEYEKHIERILSDPLFDKNNSKFLNTKWKETSNYFLGRDQSIFNPIIKKAFSKNDDKLIKLLLDNGVNYINKFILCVDPHSYSHSAIILKFNKPIKFEDSHSDVAGVLYTLSISQKTNHPKKNIFYKIFLFFRKIFSFIFPRKFHMAKILLTSDDFRYIKIENRNKRSDYSLVNNKNIKHVIDSSFNILSTLNKIETINLVDYNANNFNYSLKTLTSDIEKISYFFSLRNVNIPKDKIIDYSFDNGNVNLKISPNQKGYSIYKFIWEDCQKLNLTYTQKLQVIKKFLDIECLKLLKENKIIDKDATTFDLNDFYKLSEKIPNDFKEKFRYTKTTTFDLSKEPSSDEKLSTTETAKRGFKILSELEKFNDKNEFYSIFSNNCITTLKRTLSSCSSRYNELIKKANKNLNIIQQRHPASVLTELKKLNNDK